MLSETIDIISHWVVHKDRMRANINATRGLTFSQSVLLALTRKGSTREDAYALVQRNSLKAWNENLDFKALILADPEIGGQLTPTEIEGCFSLVPYLEKIDYIFERVLAHES
jgi:adenylosuccinate lyase